MLKSGTLLLGMLAAVTLAATVPASAQTRGRGDGTGPVGTACAREIDRYCSGVSHGRGAARACLQDHRGKLSRRCKSALDNTGGGMGRGRW